MNLRPWGNLTAGTARGGGFPSIHSRLTAPPAEALTHLDYLDIWDGRGGL